MSSNIRETLDGLLTIFDEESAAGIVRDDARIELAREALANGPKLVSIKIKHKLDECPNLDDHLGEYSNSPGPEDRTIDRKERGNVGRDEYRYFIAAMSGEETGNPKSVEQDYRRMEDYNNGQWYMMGIIAVAEVHYPTGRGYSRIERMKSSGLWGIESDSDAEYIKEIEQEELDDLREHLEQFGVDVSNFNELAAQAKREG